MNVNVAMDRRANEDNLRVGAVATAAGRCPVVAATGSQSYADTIALTKSAEEAGADAVLVVTPYYIKPSQSGLVEYFVRKIARECNRDVRGVSAGALEVLTRYDWPGNVRELENVLHRAVVLARSPVIHLQDVPLDVAMPETGSRLGEDTGPPLREALEQFERQYILRVLEGTGWNVSRTARRLGVHRNTVLTKLSGWGIQRPGTGEGRSLSL